MLLRVPNEILAHIFSIIECEDVEGGWDTKSSYSALLSLSRVCKRFRVIAEFYLYRNIFLLEEDSDEKWLQFARGLQRDPERGLTTRKFCSQRYDPMAPPNFLRFLTKSQDCHTARVGIQNIQTAIQKFASASLASHARSETPRADHYRPKIYAVSFEWHIRK
ncbi:hypothetical protein Forpe1208_v008664 [Fusarium oxysporum f. sp. rapae]|uniref:F-box domain-containing protein n=1 Tax=Fusarium oxysporum f. sp. rapae TaxID=485398 RepID=A0A8J5NVM9_FUSOX|nr:hypothetical protein Forpe1208_v008664 [Fusarium oxysporum f. sp. rapae]